MQEISPFATVRVLAHKGFRYLWFGQIASQLASNMLLFLLALLVYQRTGSNTAVSGLFLAYGLPAVVFGMVAGVVVEHLDKRTVLVVCDLSRALLVVFLFLFARHLWVMYVFVFVNAVINQLYIPAEGPSIPKLVPGNELLSANSLFSFTYYSSMAFGFVLSGPLLRIFGPAFSLLFLSGLFVLASWFVVRVPADEQKGYGIARAFSADVGNMIRRVHSELRAGIESVMQSRPLSDSLLLLTGTQIMLAILGTLGPGFADRMLTIDVRDASVVIIGPVVAGIIVGALWVGDTGHSIKPGRLIQIGIVSAGVILIAVSAMVWLKGMPWVLPVAVVLFFLLGVANSFLDVPANSMLQKESQGPMRSRVYGILAAAVGGVGLLPVVLGGLLADVIGIGKVIFLLGAIICAYGVYRIRYNRMNQSDQ